MTLKRYNIAKSSGLCYTFAMKSRKLYKELNIKNENANCRARRKAGIFLLCICLMAGAGCLSGLFYELNIYKKAEDVYQYARQQWLHPKKEGTQNTTTEEDISKIASLKAEFPDLVGFIWDTDGVLDYPIVQGSDNEYYLTHLANGADSPIGSIFLDAGNKDDFSDTLSIIYGHHLKNGGMFGSLDKYKDEEYFRAHPLLYLTTKEHCFEIHLVGAYLADAANESYPSDCTTSQQMDDFLRGRAADWIVSGSWEIAPGDRLIILSTCAYEFEDARLSLVGLLREQY